MKLTRSQRHTLALCLESNAAWTTAPDCENHRLLKSWARKGWAEEIKSSPFMMPAFRITEAGRAVLQQTERGNG